MLSVCDICCLCSDTQFNNNSKIRTIDDDYQSIKLNLPVHKPP